MGVRGLPTLQQFDPDAVWVLHERLVPPVPPADFAGTDDDLDPSARQFGDGSVEVIDIEREVVEFLTVDVRRTESAPFGVPVQFEKLISAGAPLPDDLLF